MYSKTIIVNRGIFEHNLLNSTNRRVVGAEKKMTQRIKPSNKYTTKWVLTFSYFPNLWNEASAVWRQRDYGIQ